MDTGSQEVVNTSAKTQNINDPASVIIPATRKHIPLGVTLDLFNSDMISECHLKLRTAVRCQELVQEWLSVSMIGQGWLFLRLAHCATVFARTDSILRNCLSFALTRLSFSTASFSTRSQSELESSRSSRISSSENPSCWARRMKLNL